MLVPSVCGMSLGTAAAETAMIKEELKMGNRYQQQRSLRYWGHEMIETCKSSADNCASKSEDRIIQAVALLHGKWTVHILCKMRSGPVRLGYLKRTIPTASKKGLTSSQRAGGVWLGRETRYERIASSC